MAREPIAVDALPLNFFVGTGASGGAVGVTGLPGQERIYLQHLSGGTTVIVPAALSGFSVILSGYSAGFAIPTSPVLPMKLDISGTFYLTASGSTALVQVVRMRSQGFEGATAGYNGTN